jgi:hypothetical protein
MPTIHTREEMYELVWTVPMRTLARGFGISDVALRKRCVRAAVPVPPSGYWTQLRCGHNPARLPLPPRPLGMDPIVGTAAMRHAAATVLDADIEGRLSTGDWSPERLRKRLRARFVDHLADIGSRVHPLIERCLERDKVLLATTECRRSRLPFDGPIFEGPFERRRLALLSKLFLICERAGARVALSGRRANAISVTINHVTLDLLLADDSEIRFGHNPYPLERPAGDAPLTLAVLKPAREKRWHRSWRDANGQKLVDRLATIAAELFIHAEERHREKLRDDCAHREGNRQARMRDIERQAREAEREHRAQAGALEQRRATQLLSAARAHHDAKLVEAYVDHLREHAPPQDRAAFEHWAQWAASVAEGSAKATQPGD